VNTNREVGCVLYPFPPSLSQCFIPRIINNWCIVHMSCTLLLQQAPQVITSITFYNNSRDAHENGLGDFFWRFLNFWAILSFIATMLLQRLAYMYCTCKFTAILQDKRYRMFIFIFYFLRDSETRQWRFCKPETLFHRFPLFSKFKTLRQLFAKNWDFKTHKIWPKSCKTLTFCWDISTPIRQVTLR